MVDPRDFPDEVAKLYKKHNGRISHTHEGFFFDCPKCKGAAVCRLEQTVTEDTWLTHCKTVGCKLHGEQELAVMDLEDEEIAARKADAKRYKRDRDDMIAQIESMLAVAAEINEPDADYAKLLDRIVDMIRSYVFIGREEAMITALWIAHTWCLPAAEHTPYIHLRSALPREGKSILMEIAKYLVARPLIISDPTPAAIADRVTRYLVTQGEAPTFLWDEIDSVFERRPELREYVNMGYRRDESVVIRVAGDWFVWGPKMIAGLTNLTGGRMATIRDRSFRFDMMEPLPEEQPLDVYEYRDEIKLEANEIKLALNVMAEQHIPYLSTVKPEMPDELDSRGRDISRPLLAIADLIGGDWPDKARHAVTTIRSRMNQNEMSEDKVLLLRDIKSAFGIMREMPTSLLVERLRAKQDSPWAQLTPRKLAILLHDFSEYPGGPRIMPKVMRIKGKQVRGYKRTQFRDAWKRYLRRLR